MKRLTLYLTILILLLGFVGTANAQTETAVTLTTNPDQPLTIGDPIQLTVQVEHPAGTSVILPQLPAQWGDFVVRSQSAAITAVHDDGRQITSQTIDARLFRPGDFQTPPFTISVSDGSGQLQEVSADPLSITIASVLVEGDTTLRDIKPQATLPVPLIWPWGVGGALLLAVLAYGLWRQRQTAVSLIPVLDTRPPHQIALDELTRITGLDLPNKGRFKEHYTLISDCLRTYTEKILDLSALEKTTDELRYSLRRTTLEKHLSRNLIELLRESDLVKFSKFMPEREAALVAVARATAFVEATRPAMETDDDTPMPPPISTHGQPKVEVAT